MTSSPNSLTSGNSAIAAAQGTEIVIEGKKYLCQARAIKKEETSQGGVENLQPEMLKDLFGAAVKLAQTKGPFQGISVTLETSTTVQSALPSPIGSPLPASPSALSPAGSLLSPSALPSPAGSSLPSPSALQSPSALPSPTGSSLASPGSGTLQSPRLAFKSCALKTPRGSEDYRLDDPAFRPILDDAEKHLTALSRMQAQQSKIAEFCANIKQARENHSGKTAEQLQAARRAVENMRAHCPEALAVIRSVEFGDLTTDEQLSRLLQPQYEGALNPAAIFNRVNQVITACANTPAVANAGVAPVGGPAAMPPQPAPFPVANAGAQPAAQTAPQSGGVQQGNAAANTQVQPDIVLEITPVI